MAKGPSGKKPGTPMGGLEESAARKRRRAKARKREEREWAEKSGPVKSYFKDPPL
jgi:hypothetical protein